MTSRRIDGGFVIEGDCILVDNLVKFEYVV
jgi:hypothetical protein